MAFTKKQAAEAGKKSTRKGVPNKVDSRIRQAIEELINSNLPKLQELLDKTAAESPKAALDIIIKLAEFSIPKLARVQMQVDNPEPKHFTIEVIEGEEKQGE